MKRKIILGSSVLAMFLVACGVNNTLSSEQIGLRRVNLENENAVKLPDFNYTSSMPGESALIERSYQNAPPLIPHEISDMLPITRDNNSCLSCHDKSVASSVGATPIPPTHYFNYRTDKKTGDQINDARFNCTQCHVPQSDAKPIIGNSFKPDFQNNQLKNKSNLIDVMNEGVK